MQGLNTDSPRGYAFAIAAYGLWGFLPLYMKALSDVGAVEVLAHRVLWSVPVAGAVLLYLGRTQDITAALRSPRTLAMGCVTSLLISVNWGVYIYAIVSGQAMEAALGYYVNPLFSILLGAVFLGERLGPQKYAAIALAGIAVVVLTVETGSLPVLALLLTFSWGLYAFCKKSLPVGPNQGFLLEVLLLSPLALGYVGYLVVTGAGHFGGPQARETLLLMGCGVVTAVPLMLYANGAKLLRLSTIGMLQYIAPTMIFLTAVFIFGEPFGTARAIAFPLIWLALLIYSHALWKESRGRAALS